eukprot:GHVS01064186.1.p1 GENE.GHVS01064186.1~~GHVS01064186.1.p1  ORF type:complete len:594 (+),score=167.30 GHVS01064186.1:210-1991(+)
MDKQEEDSQCLKDAGTTEFSLFDEDDGKQEEEDGKEDGKEKEDVTEEEDGEEEEDGKEEEDGEEEEDGKEEEGVKEEEDGKEEADVKMEEEDDKQEEDYKQEDGVKKEGKEEEVDLMKEEEKEKEKKEPQKTKSEKTEKKISKTTESKQTTNRNGKRPLPVHSKQMTLSFPPTGDGGSSLKKPKSASPPPSTAAVAAPKASQTGSLFACAVRTADKSLESPFFSPASVEVGTVTTAGSKNGTDDGEKQMLFEVLCNGFDMIGELKGSGAGSKKLASIVLANMYRLLIFYCPSQLAPAVYLCLNKVCPDYMGVEVGVGESILIKCIVTTYGRTDATLKQDIQKYEDLGAVAAASSCRVRTLFPPPRLTVSSVFTELKAVADCSGHSSQQKKKDKISKLLVSAKRSEPKYIVRFLQQKMRIGVQTASVYQALAFAFALTRPRIKNESVVEAIADTRTTATSPLQGTELDAALCDLEKAVRAGLCEMPNIDHMVNLLLRGETAQTLPLSCVITPGVPVQPMLAKPTKGIGEVLDRFSNSDFTCEFKYDGERAQIHLVKPGLIKVFSRNLEDLTPKYPDMIEFIAGAIQPVHYKTQH